MIAIDFETYLISQEQPVPKPVCLSFYTGTTSGLKVGHSDMALFLKEILSSSELIVAHNATFELLTIYIHFPELQQLVWDKLNKNEIFCTYIYESLLNNIRDKALFKLNLAALVKMYFDVDISAGKENPDAWRLRYSELDGVALSDWPIEAVQYAIDDSIWAYAVYNEQYKTQVNWQSNVKASFALNLMGKFGILTDATRVGELRDDLLAFLTPRKERLIELGFVSVDSKGKYHTHAKVLREYIEKNFTNVLYSDKGVVQTGAEALLTYIGEKEDEALTLFNEMAAFEKVFTTYIPPLTKAGEGDKLIRSDYSPTVSSNRTSSHGSKNYASVNIQNAPRAVKGARWDVRNCYIPRPGFKICSIDYNGLELASCAHQLNTFFGGKAICQMAQALNFGTEPADLHSRLGTRLMQMEGHNVTYEEFLENKKKEPFKQFRQIAKPIGLGFPGGIGYDTIRMLLAKDGIRPGLSIMQRFNNIDNDQLRHMQGMISLLRSEHNNIRMKQFGKNDWALVKDDIVKFKRALFDIYPDLEQFLRYDHTQFQNGKTKRVKNEFGTWELEEQYKYQVKDAVRDNCSYTAFCNGYLMQTPAALGAKQMMYKVIEKYYKDDRMNPLAFIHDEIVFEVLDNNEKYDIIKDVAYIMIDEMQKILPSVRIAVEAELMDYWAKAGGFWTYTFWKDKRG